MQARLGKKLPPVSRWKIAALAMVLSLLQEPARARADDALVAEAHKERGTVRWYTALAVNGSKPLADAFEKNIRFLKSPSTD